MLVSFQLQTHEHLAYGADAGTPERKQIVDRHPLDRSECLQAFPRKDIPHSHPDGHLREHLEVRHAANTFLQRDVP
ncbi:hypothetical protein [Microbacterium aurantiacum]|uniref:hypothetical protein n=1 Tax=Microbacterium aurantiacum TaxID=162393 RepID=UPI0007DA5F20|nr:hypothetical protein [Microbacterium chocolatum]ANG86895.1 hypothetical protein A8L33_15095 [Microbacterium chocolatum]